jgi:hypothetical protein
MVHLISLQAFRRLAISQFLLQAYSLPLVLRNGSPQVGLISHFTLQVYRTSLLGSVFHQAINLHPACL